MALCKAVVRLPYFTGTPEDVVVNTLYYQGVALGTVQQGAIMAGIQDFFTVGAALTNIGSYIAPWVSRAPDACQIELYDMDDPLPRQPIASSTFTLTAPSGTGTLPPEVAKCLSFRAAYESGSPNARRRGRIYVGPLSSAAITGGSVSAFATPATSLQNALTGQARDFLYDAPLVEGMSWCVYSPSDLLARTVIEVWADNAFDTQRRRGNAPTSRVTVTM